MARRHTANVEVKLQAVFTLQQDCYLHTSNALIQVRELLDPNDEKDKRVPQMVCARKQRESLYPFQPWSPRLQPDTSINNQPHFTYKRNKQQNKG